MLCDIDATLEKAPWIVPQIKDQRFHALPLQLSQCGGKIAVRFLVEIRDPDIADAAFFHASVDALDLDFASCQRHFAGGSIGRLQSHCHLRPIFAAKLFYNLVQAFARHVLPVNGKDDVPCLDAGFVSRCIFNGRNNDNFL